MRRTRRSVIFGGAAALVAAVLLGGAVAGAAGPVAVGGHRPEAPVVSGDRVVWADHSMGSYDIYLYDGSSGDTKRITSGAGDEIQPDISGDLVVWAAPGASGFDIFGYNIITGSTTTVRAATGDQVNPSVCGTWVVWEDRAASYTAQIWAVNTAGGTAFKVDSGYGIPKRRPRVGGTVVVYEDYPRGPTADSDVIAYDLVTRVKTRVAGTTANEAVPETDGQVVVWADSSSGDADIKGYDRSSAVTFSVRSQPGEQTLPVVDAGEVYWIDNDPQAPRQHVDSFDLSSAAFAPFDGFTANEMTGFSAGDGGTAWLEAVRSGWTVRALLGESAAAGAVPSALARLASIAEKIAGRLALIASGGDASPPRVSTANIGAGQVSVECDRSFTVYFDEPLDPASVSGETFSIRDSGGDRVAVRVDYSALARAVTLAPADPLGDGTYVLDVAPGVRDAAGNASASRLSLPFATSPRLADTLYPSQPGSPVARVSGLSNVEVSWSASTDDVGVIAYDVYRSATPITSVGALTPIVTVAGSVTATTVANAAGEQAGKYTRYYAIVARDASGKSSTVSNSAVPDPHGTYVTGANTAVCQLCHAVHGAVDPDRWALGAQSKEACYDCHGSTAAATAYGYASTLNSQARFWDYAATPLPASGSRHRNTYMDTQNEECSACHTPHKKPYDVDPTLGFTKLLRRFDALLGKLVYYRSDGSVVDASGAVQATGFGEAFCLSCHGTDTTKITAVGGATAYSSTAGDHETGFSTAAHGPSTVREDPTRPLDEGPKVSCAACHNKHAAAVGNLIDYRTTNTAASTYDQSGLCFACHVDNYVAEYNGGVNWSSNSANAYFAWNGRNLRTEFTRASHHPYTYAASGASASCYSCHNTHTVQKGTAGQAWQPGRVSDPEDTQSLYTDVSGSFNDFCLTCHDSTVPSQVVNQSSTLVPYDIRFSTISSAYFPGWDKTLTGLEYTNSKHGTLAATRCQNCHDPHGSNFARLTAFTGGATVRANTTAASSKEQNLCLNTACHASSGLSYQVGTQFTQTYRHPVATDDRHADTEGQANLGSANRHSECVDCHDPHIARTGTHSGSTAGAAVRGAFGVRPTTWPARWTSVASTGYTLDRMDGGASDLEINLCLKCHSSYSGQPFSVTTASGTYTSTDLALEFNPNNASYHNVTGQATGMKSSFSYVDSGGTTRNETWFIPTVNVFRTGYTANTMIACSDCHGASAANAAKGPHGSAAKWIIDPSYSRDWKTVGLSSVGGTTAYGMAYLNGGVATNATDVICAKCHDLYTSGGVNSWSNSAHANSNHFVNQSFATGGNVMCNSCHTSIPHGWKRPRLLSYITDTTGGAYNTKAGGVTRIAANSPPTNSTNGAAWTRSDCGAACNTGEHPNPATYIP